MIRDEHDTAYRELVGMLRAEYWDYLRSIAGKRRLGELDVSVLTLALWIIDESFDDPDLERVEDHQCYGRLRCIKRLRDWFEHDMGPYRAPFFSGDLLFDWPIRNFMRWQVFREKVDMMTRKNTLENHESFFSNYG